MRIAPRIRHARRRARGAAAIETALSLIVLMFIVSAGLNFGHAMVVRHRLVTATSRAVRICALGAPDTAEACVVAQVNAGLGATAGACVQPMRITANAQQIDTVDVLAVDARCEYVGGPWGPFLATMMEDAPLTLTANSVMPRR